MHSFLLRPANLLVLLSYLALSTVPLLPLAWGRGGPRPGGILLLEFACWALLWAVCKRPARFHWLLLPAFLALPADLYLQRFYGQSISAHHLGILAETSPAEALEFLGDRAGLLLAALTAAGGWWWLSWRATKATHDLDWSGRSRSAVLLLFALGLGAWLYERAAATPASAPAARGTAAAGTSASGMLGVLPAWIAPPFSATSFAATRPFGLGAAAYEFWTERRYLASLIAGSHHFSFGARQATAAARPQVVVMVIGESARYDRWGLNGYARATTPRLAAETNLVSLGNLITAVSATRLSVPVIMSRKPARQSLQPGFAEKSFLSAFREAGFKTWWLSNQMSFGKFDTPVSVYASEADVTRFLNPGNVKDGSSLDRILLPALQRAVADPAPRKLIVLHTLGSHWNYAHRYPPQYDRWQPSLRGLARPVPTDPEIKTAMNNSYDNSILYTDYILAQVIDRLRTTQQLAAMLYVSDHGQSLHDGNCKLAMHGHNTQYDFHVPALVWYSDAWGATWPDKLRQLQQHRDAPLTTENIFHSLLDLADIRYPDQRLDWSIFSEQWRPHTRYVDSYGWSDYDNASFKGDCREVIDKGTPLPRE